MMDPFTALGLASAVLQFIDFGSTVYGEYKRLRNGSSNGSGSQNGNNNNNNARVVQAVPKSFEAALNDLITISRVLKTTPRLNNASETQQNLIQHEEAINSLLNQATEMAEDFLTQLQYDHPDRSRWNSLAEAINAIRTEGELDHFKERLDGFRRELGIHVLALMNSNVEFHYGMQHHYDLAQQAAQTAQAAQGRQQREEIIRLRQDFTRLNEKVVKIVAFSQSVVRSGSSSTSSTPIFDQHARLLAEEKQGGGGGLSPTVVAAMVTLASGETRFVYPSGRTIPPGMNGSNQFHPQNGHSHHQAPSSSSSSSSSLNNDSTKFDTLLHLSSDPNLLCQPASASLEHVPSKDFFSLTTTILNTLHFPQLTSRFDSIKPPHPNTFNWVFSHHHSKNPSSTFDTICRPPWSPLTTFLENKDEKEGKCYWIKGRPGTGKSTLMKYILCDPRLGEHLQRWAHTGDDIISTSFFPHHLGSSNERLISGLMRSVLYQVLSARPDLIPTVMPETCLEAARSCTGKLETPSAAELRGWFDRLLNAAATGTGRVRLFVAVDGVDELLGDAAEELLHVIRNTKGGERVKWLVASRGMQMCAKALGAYPGLKMQDLTGEDVRRYTEGMLGEVVPVQVRERGVGGAGGAAGGEEWFRLVNEIVKRSEGVFLWVALVIRSLQQNTPTSKGGLLLQNHHHDTSSLKEMRKRLDQIPGTGGDIEKLYGHMLKKIPPDYKKNAAKLFRIVLASVDIEQQIREHPILAIQLSLAEGVWDEVKLIPEGSLTWDLEEVRVRDIEARVGSRCLGLLEVHARREDKTHKPYIDFTHRTAVDFLRESQVAIDFLYGTLSSDFNPQAYLVRSCLTMARVMPTTTYFDGDVVWDSMRTCLEYARIAEYKKRPVFDGYLDRLDQAMSRHWFVALSSTIPSSSPSDIHRLHHWSQKASWFWTGPKDVDMALVQAEFNQFCYPPLYIANPAGASSTTLDEETQRLLREIDLGFLVVAIMYSLPTYLRTCLHRLKEAEEEIEATMKRKSHRKNLINKIDKIKGGKQTYVPPKVAHTATRLLFLWAQLTAASANFCIVPWTKPHARVCRTLLEFGANPMCEFTVSVGGGGNGKLVAAAAAAAAAHRNAWELTSQAILVLVHPALRKKQLTELLPNQKVRAVLWITNFFVKNGADRNSKVPGVVLNGCGMKNLVLECPGRAKEEEATLLEWLEPYAKGPATNEVGKKLGMIMRKTHRVLKGVHKTKGWRRRKSRRPNGEGGDEFDEDSDDYGSEDDEDYDDDSDDDGRSVIMPASRGDRGEQIFLRKPLRRAGSGDTLLDDVMEGDKPLPPIPRETESSLLSTQAGMPEIVDEADYNSRAKTPVMHHQALPDTPPPSAPDEIFFLPTASFVELPNSTPPSPTETISPILPPPELAEPQPTPPPRPHEPTPEMQQSPRFSDFPRMPLSPLSQRFPLSPLSQRFPLSPVSPRMPLSPLSPGGPMMAAPSPADFLFPPAFRAAAFHHRRQTEPFPGLGINPSCATLVDPNSDDVEDLYPDVARAPSPSLSRRSSTETLVDKKAPHYTRESLGKKPDMERPVHPLELAMQRGELSDSDQETVRGRRGRNRSNTMTTSTTSATTNTTATTSTTTGRHREAREIKRREEKEDKERRERDASRAARKLPEPKGGKQGYAKYLGQTGAKAAAVVPQKLFNLAFWVGDWCKRAYGRCSWVVKIRW